MEDSRILFTRVRLTVDESCALYFLKYNISHINMFVTINCKLSTCYFKYIVLSQDVYLQHAPRLHSVIT